MPQHGWLRCKIRPGSLAREYAVTIKTSDGDLISLFAPEEFIRASQPEGEGQISVDVVDSDSEFSLVSLPRPTFEQGSFAKVPRQAVSVA
jgi:hypothetical protein